MNPLISVRYTHGSEWKFSCSLMNTHDTFKNKWLFIWKSEVQPDWTAMKKAVEKIYAR